jgi:hypothetical protein
MFQDFKEHLHTTNQINQAQQDVSSVGPLITDSQLRSGGKADKQVFKSPKR